MINMQWKCIDAISIIPCLDKVDDNFHFFLEDAWNIVFENGIIHTRNLETTELTEISFDEYGNLLLWILSFLDLYNEFHDRKEVIIHTYSNYLMLVGDYFEGKECIEEYIRSNGKLTNNKCDEVNIEENLEMIIRDDIKDRKTYIRKRFDLYINRRLGKVTDEYKKDLLVSIFTCVNWLNRYAQLTPAIFTQLIELGDAEFTQEIKVISESSFSEVVNAALPYYLSMNLSIEYFKYIPYLIIGESIVHFNKMQAIIEYEMEEESIDYDILRDYQKREGFVKWLNKWFN